MVLIKQLILMKKSLHFKKDMQAGPSQKTLEAVSHPVPLPILHIGLDEISP